MLYACYEAAVNDKDFSGQLADIKARYQEIIDGLNLDCSLDKDFEIICENFRNKAGEDYAASRGEFLNGKIMSSYLGFEFVDAADVVLMKSRLSDVPAAIRLSRATLKNIHENLFWAFFYNVIGIPLAAGVWIPLFGWQLNPMFGAAAMSLSSVCVVGNALRLNWFNMYDAGRDRKIKDSKKKEETTMTKTMKIEGMMCGHCEARVKKVLEALPEVDAAEVSHEAGTAVVTLNAEISDEVLKKTVEDKDYKVLSIL